MFKRREEIKELLKGKHEDFIDRLGKIITIENADLARVISVTDEEIEELKEMEGEIVSGLGNSWSNRVDEHIEMFTPAISHDSEVYFLVSNAKGYQVQYFSDWIMDEELAYELQNDEVYIRLMEEIGSGEDMYGEAEVILSNDIEFKIVNVFDERDEVGYVTVELELV